MAQPKNLLDPNAFKVMKRYVPWQEVGLSLLLPFVVTLVATGALLTPQDWGLLGVLIMGAAVVGSWVAGLTMLWNKIRAAPDFETDFGSLVWTNKLPITQRDVSRAQDHYMKLLSGRKLASRTAIGQMFNDMRIEFVKKPIPYGPKQEKLANGLAWPPKNSIKVRWLEGFHRNAFFHENMHVTQENIWGKAPDVDHKIDADWELVREAKRTYPRGG